MVTRFECLQFLAEVAEDALIMVWVCGGGKAEWHHARPNPPSIILDIGITTPVGLGLALALPHRRVIVIDTDGGLLFNLGVLATLGNLGPPNLKVFVIDNECYEGTGGQPTATAGRADLAAMARGAGIEKVETARTLDEFKEAAKHALSDKALHFIVAKVEKGTKKLPAKAIDGVEAKYSFVRYIEKTEKISVINPPLQRHPEHLLK